MGFVPGRVPQAMWLVKASLASFSSVASPGLGSCIVSFGFLARTVDQHEASQPDEPSVDGGAEPPKAASPPAQVEPQDPPAVVDENRVLDEENF